MGGIDEVLRRRRRDLPPVQRSSAGPLRSACFLGQVSDTNQVRGHKNLLTKKPIPRHGPRGTPRTAGPAPARAPQPAPSKIFARRGHSSEPHHEDCFLQDAVISRARDRDIPPSPNLANLILPCPPARRTLNQQPTSNKCPTPPSPKPTQSCRTCPRRIARIASAGW